MLVPRFLQKKNKEWFASVRVGRRFMPELRPEFGRLLVLGLLSLGVVALDILRPWPIKWIIDYALVPAEGTANSPGKVIFGGAVATVLIVCGKAVTQYFREIGLGRTELQLTRQLRFRLFSHLSHLSPGFHARNKSGDLLVRLMGDVPMVSTMLVNSLLEVCTRALFIVATVTVMLFIDPVLTGATFIVVPVILVLIRVISKRIHVAVRKQRTKEGDLADYLHEAIAATETIQSLGGSQEVIRRFARSNRRSARAGLKAKRLAAKLSASVESLLGVGLALVFVLGSFRVLEGKLLTGDLLVFISYVRTLSKPVRSASKHASKIAKGTACGERLIAIIDQTPDVSDRSGAPDAPQRPEQLVFDDVAFSYERGTPALSGFTCAFRRGQLSALVGRSGAGKSTAASLAARLVDPDSGRVCLDDSALKNLSLDSVRKSVGLCLQRTILFGDTIRENLLLGTPEASEEQLLDALEQAGATEFVAELPEGLDTELGSSGVGLSGGQLSRLSLARTLLRDSGAIILDEPFAGLDRIATQRLGETLKRLAREKIVIAIAHDFDNIEQYEHIVFLDRGRKVDEGTHDELIERLPMYRDVVRTTSAASG